MVDFSELLMQIHSLPSVVKEEAMTIMRRNGELFAGLAQILVHVDTGELRDSIGVSATDSSVTVKAAAPHAPYVEAKYPFMRPAWELVKPQLESQLRMIQEKIDSHVTG